MVDTVAPIPQAMRYGNKAFQSFVDKLMENIESLHKEMLPESAHPAIVELSTYFSESFGNRTRIDYGTGTLPHLPSTMPYGHLIELLLLSSFPSSMLILILFASRPRDKLYGLAVLS